MPILHVRNVPEQLYEQIREQAQAHNKSINAEVIALLQRALNQHTGPQGDVPEGIQRRRFFHPNEADAPDSTSVLRQDRGR